MTCSNVEPGCGNAALMTDNADDDIEVISGPEAADPQAGPDEDGDGQRPVTDLVEQPAKVMRIGTMIKQLLEEVKAAPWTMPAAVGCVRSMPPASANWRNGLAPELRDELRRLALLLEESVPSDA